MALDLPSLVWKQLCGERLELEDLRLVDLGLCQSLQRTLNIHREGVTAEMFADVVFETFTTLSSDDREVELCPGGQNMQVTFENRHRFVELVLHYRLNEFRGAVAAMARGLHCVVPKRLLALFTWEQVERMVCGVPDVDVDLLESVTEHRINKQAKHVVFFWKALRSFSAEDKRMFLRFVWGRSRLPLNAAQFTQRFKLEDFHKSPADQYMPVAHTCFFSLELPRYTSFEVCKAKLLYAVRNCQAIDGDDTGAGMAAAQMGWE
jgi:hypothetical protein